MVVKKALKSISYEKSGLDRELTGLIIIYRWLAFVLALAYLSVQPSAMGLNRPLFLGAIGIYTTAISVLVARRHRLRLWHIAADAGVAGALLAASQGAPAQFMMYGAAPVVAGSLLFGIAGGLLSTTVVALLCGIGFFIAGSANPGLLTGNTVVGCASYTLALYALAVFLARTTNLLGGLKRAAKQLKEQVDTLASLYEVASGISSKLSIDEILESVVAQAKRIIRTDKTALYLIDGDAGSKRLRGRLVAVKGSRSEHPEAWWHAQVDAVADEVLRSGRERLIARIPDETDTRGAWLLCAPVTIKEKPVGLLAAINSFDEKFSDSDIMALTVLAGFAAVAVENARLVGRAQALLIADERSRIAKEMHDGLAQSLFSLVLQLRACQHLVEQKPQLAKEKLAEMQSVASQGLTDIRRYIYDLRPKNLEERGLIGAIDHHIKELNKLNGETGRFRVYGRRRALPADVESCLFRVMQEATNNIVKHANSATFSISLKYADDAVELLVRDRGDGFDVAHTLADIKGSQRLGLVGMKERVAEQGGEISVRSRPGRGTDIKVKLPLREQEPYVSAG